MSYSRKRPLREAGLTSQDFGDVVDVAIQTTHALMDMGQINEARRVFKDGDATLTRNPEEPGQKQSPYRGIAGKLGWRDVNALSDNLQVSCALNGADADAVAAYPHDAEMARLTVRRRLQVIGTFKSDSEPITKDDPDVGIIVAGTQTLDAVGAVPGAIAVADVPPLGQTGDGHSLQVLTTRPMNPMLVGETFQRTMSHIVTSPDAWKRAMDGYYQDASVMINAAKGLLDSHLFTALLLVQQLVAAGKLSVPAQDAQGRANDELLGAAGGQLDSLELMQRLAQFYGLIDAGNSLAFLRDPVKLGEYKQAQHRFARQAFYLPNPETGRINLADELGARYDPRAQQILTPARTSETRQLKDTPLGRLVHIQHNHVPLSVAAYTEAVTDELRNQVGTYITGGTDRAVVSMHVAS